MNQTGHTLCLPLTRLTPDDAHYFFGYYDLPAWIEDAHGKPGHLVHRVGFMDRMPTAEDVAEVGWVPVEGGGGFQAWGRTSAWNFQQGAMLQALPGGRVLYNERRGEGFRGVVREVGGGTARELGVAAANVDAQGRFVLGVNFSRLMDFRPGYGYAGVPDPFGGEAQPEEDGVFREDLATGRAELILSLRELGTAGREFFGGSKILVNHLNLNPGGTRFVALVRSFPDGTGGRLRTLAMTANADGSDLRVLWAGGVASHYHWRDDETLAMVIQDPEGRITLAEFSDREGSRRLVDPAFFLDDGHGSYSPDRRWMLYDSYPIEGRRHLYLYDLRRREGRDLGWVVSQPVDDPVALETRCDLHPRWSPDGRAITFDSVHEGFRGVYRLELDALF